jgi:flavin-binding protein dodecin
LTPNALAQQVHSRAESPHEDPGNGHRVRTAAPGASIATPKEVRMADTVYKVIELVGTSEESWEKAAKAAVERAALSLRDLRVAEVVEQDLVIENGKVESYRTKVKVSFKYEGKD